MYLRVHAGMHASMHTYLREYRAWAIHVSTMYGKIPASHFVVGICAFFA